MVHLVFFLTGALGLIYQVAWTRILVLSFGYSVYSVGTVLAAFMGGLAGGSFLGGRLSSRLKNPVWTYGLCEVGVGVIALATSWSLQHSPALFASLRNLFLIPNYGFSFWMLAIALALLLPPTILMGATLPILAKALTRSSVSGGEDIGRLYSVNTLGAALGALATGFFLLALLGIRQTILIAALGNIFLGVLICFLFRKASPTSGASISNAALSLPPEGSRYRDPMIWAFGISGFVALASEVYWTRILSPFLESSIYAFSLVLGVFLLGIVAGSAAAKPIAGKRIANCYAGYGLSQVLVALFMGLGMMGLKPFIRKFALTLPNLGALLQDSQLIPQMVFWLMLLIFPSTFFMGFGFPFVAQWASGNLERVGERTGRAYAFNTIGAVAGSLAAGFLLIPHAGILPGWVILMLASMFSGLFLFSRLPKEEGFTRSRKVLAVMACFLFGLLVIRFPDPNRLATRIAYPPGTILAHREDADGSVTLYQVERDGMLLLNINLRPVSGSSTALTPWMTHLPLLSLPQKEELKILNIGLGIGHTFTTALQYPQARVDVVELLPSVVGLFKDYHPDAEKYLHHPRARVIVGDGRAYLTATKERYDAIIIDPTPPLYGAGVVNLYTKDFFEICRKKMTDTGVLMLRLPYDTTDLTTALLVKTMGEAFPGVSLWQRFKGSGYSLLGHSDASQIPTFGELQSRVRLAPFLTDEEKETLLELTPASILSADEIQKLTAGMPFVSDERPYLEHPLYFSWWEKKWKSK